MPKSKPIFYSALLLTLVNLLLRFVGTSFQVYISSAIGAAGVGLLQLTMSVGSFAMIAGIGGIRTATMYLTAGELGHGREKNVGAVLSACFVYSIVCSGSVAIILYFFAPRIAQHWIGDIRTLASLRLFAAFLPCCCLSAVMTGYFTAANRIGTLAAVEVAEQFCSMGITMAALSLWAGGDASRACLCVVLGSSLGSVVTLSCLVFLRLRQPSGPPVKLAVAHRLVDTAVPLALADVLKAGINTVENLMVPKRLARNLPTVDPLAAFGLVSGMVFPIIMFPACILFGLAELLIPELARCAASGSHRRISYLVHRSLKVSMLYGSLFSGLIWLLAEPLCLALYGSMDAAGYLRLYALLIPMLYCDAITDAMTKGLGQQKICVRYNILTSALDVIFLYLLLPGFGMDGYFISFLVTHLLNFLLSMNRLLKITEESLQPWIPLFTAAAGILSCAGCAGLTSPLIRCLFYPAMLVSLLYLLGVIRREDLHWLRGLIAQTSRK